MYGRELGVSRRTVHQWIATGQLDRELDEAPVRYAARPPVERKVDPFRGIPAARLAEFRLPWGQRYALLFDQLKAVIVDDGRAIGGRLLENGEFMRFAAHRDFRIRACRPYRAKTKGKVERPVSCVRQGFFYGRGFLNDDDLNAQALSWLAQTANARPHRTTVEVPRLRFERDERALLRPLAARPYRSRVVATSPPEPPRPRSRSASRSRP